MGGKPQKPKIQAYVDQRWFDEFEIYRATHNLNQSKALEKLLAEFFGGASASTLPLDGAIATSNLVYALRSELVDLKLEIDHRLQLVESRLATESAHKSAVAITESASESATLQDELAVPLDESAVDIDGLATESATAPDRLASESAIVEDARAVNSLEDTALGDIGEVENASVGNMVEDIPALAAPSSESVEETVVEKASVTPAKIEKPVRSPKKSGKKLPGATKKLVEEKLLPGQRVTAKELAELIEMTEAGVNFCKKTKKLHEWGVELVPDTFPQLFQRI